MKRLYLLFLILLLTLPVTLHANTAWIAPDPYLAQHPDSANRYFSNKQDYIALCNGHLYKSPQESTLCGIYTRGQSLHIEYYCYDSIYKWGLVTDSNGIGIGWVPMDAMQLTYGPKDYLDDHWDSLRAYVGELDPLLPSPSEIEAIEQYRMRYTGGDMPADWMAFDFPRCTAWAYPNAPISYGTVWSPDLYPVHTLIDENGTVWVYAHERWRIELGNTDHPFWVCVSDPTARPNPRTPALKPELKDAPTHLPVPGQLALEKVTAASFLMPLLPAILTVLSTTLLSAALIALLQRRKVT